ncbi:hypothetical protein F5X99DRAFT_108706 [Biscogniauxia marginata]|nr:hypothetical protein F5X99DRAFT_108706 [Biscogniauxia marginata]
MKSSSKVSIREEKGKKNPLSKYKVIRRLGSLEGFQSAQHSLGHYYSTVVTCRYAVPSSLADPDFQPQLEDALERAIAHVVLEAPALRVGLVGQDTRKPVWVGVDTVDLRRHIEWRVLEPTTDLDQLYLDLVARRIDTPFVQLETVPGWRVLVLRVAGSQSLDVVFEWNHANMDGMSAKIFHQMLLQQLNSSISNSGGTASLNPVADHDDTPSLHNHILTIPPTARPLVPPIEKLVRFTLTPGWTLSQVWKELKPPPSKKETVSSSSTSSFSTPLARWAPIRPQPYKARHRQFLLPDDRVRNVLAGCHARGATLTSLAHVIVAVSLATRLPPSAARGFIGETAIDMRRFMPTAPETCPWLEDPDRELGDFVSLVMHEFDGPLLEEMRTLSSSSSSSSLPPQETGNRDQPSGPVLSSALEEVLWFEATRVRRDIQEKLDLGLKNDPVGLTKFVVDWRTIFKDRARKPRHSSWAVSNLGVLDGSPPLSNVSATNGESEKGIDVDKCHDNRWGIERGMFSFGPEATGAAMRIGLLSVKGRDLCVSCCWQDSVVDVKIGEALTADLERWLRYLGRQVE